MDIRIESLLIQINKYYDNFKAKLNEYKENFEKYSSFELKHVVLFCFQNIFLIRIVKNFNSDVISKKVDSEEV